MRRLTNRIALAVLLLPAAAHALDYRAVSPEKAVLYDAPSPQAKKLFIARQFYPVEIMVNLGDWIKVRDARGELAWIEAKQLTTKRTVVVTAPQAEVRDGADPNAHLVFRAEKDVALEWLEPAQDGWVRVRHRDGLTGYVLTSSVWGL